MYVHNRKKTNIAQQYVRLGYKVLPVHTVENGNKCSCGQADCGSVAKHPLTQHGVKDATNDPETVERYFGGEYDTANIGVATGEPSGVWHLDVDVVEDLQKLEAIHGKLPPTWLYRTGGGGLQYVFRWDERCKDFVNSVKFSGALDVRSTGTMAVAPPSKHASGGTYEWIRHPESTPLATAPQWLIDLIPKREAKTGDVGVVEDDVRRAAANTSTNTKANTSPNTFTVSAETPLEDRLRRYLEATPPAISGERGHDATFKLCCKVVEVFGVLPDTVLIEHLETWNDTCLPPWKAKELRHKLSEARKRVGVIVDEPEPDDEDEDVFVDDPEPTDEFPTLEPAAYHGVAGEILRTLEPHTEADSASLLLTFLSAFGVAVGRSPHFVVEGTKHHGNIFVAVVGQSSRARKGTSLGRIRELMAECGLRPASGLASGEGLIFNVRDAGVSDKGVTDKRLWIVESEFARPLKAMKRETCTLSAVLRDAWDTGDLQTLTRNNPAIATGSHVGIVTHITNEELSKTLDDSEIFNGFGNRFLWTVVRRSKLLPDGGSVDVSGLRQRITETVTKASTIGRMIRSPEASKLWRDVYPILGAEKTGLYDAVTSRAESQVVRLSILYALLDGVSTIEVVHLNAALAVWRYCERSAQLLFAEAGDESIDRQIVAIVRQSPGAKRSDVRDKFRHDKATTKAFDSALAMLAKRGEIEIKTETVNGRKADRLYPGDGREKPSPVTPSIVPVTKLVTPKPVTPPVSPLPVTITPPKPEPVTSTVTPATLIELFNWRNSNGVKFCRLEDGTTWVTQEHLSRLTPAIEAAIRTNQETMALFVPSPGTDTIVTLLSSSPELETGIVIDEEDFLREAELSITLSTEGEQLYEEFFRECFQKT